METARTSEAMRLRVAAAKQAGLSVGLVPTMGALHAGHRSLVRQAKAECGFVVVSIFVNPTQFGLGEDYQDYPRSPEADLAACREEGVDLVFSPDVDEVYPGQAVTTVRVTGLTEGLCGPHRPGHFDGVCTVVAKLFHMVSPDVAFFGEKDYQQLQVIRRMVADLNMPVQIVGCPTVREPDGLALSSRNALLSATQRRQAAHLYQAMRQAADAVSEGGTQASRLIQQMEAAIREAGPCDIDYVKIVHPDSLMEIEEVTGPARICLAVRIGRARLIDNLAVAGRSKAR
ncbi:MAG: pantoate--beta-alanine ligase [Phycisphaerae bacterium]